MLKEVSYAEAMKKKYPEQVVYAVCREKSGKVNIIVLGWMMPTSGVPPMVAISVGHTRYSHDIIKETREFVVAFPSSTMEREMLICGTKSGRDIDKIRETGHKTVPAKVVNVPLIAGCVANFECKVVSELVTGDHTIFAGEVVAAHVEDSPDVTRLYNFGDMHFGPAGPE